MNEQDLQVASDDVDLFLAGAGGRYRNIWTPCAGLFHNGSATGCFETMVEKQEILGREAGYMEKRWGEQQVDDPAYSPNLALDDENFDFSWLPRGDILGENRG